MATIEPTTGMNGTMPSTRDATDSPLVAGGAGGGYCQPGGGSPYPQPGGAGGHGGGGAAHWPEGAGPPASGGTAAIGGLLKDVAR